MAKSGRKPGRKPGVKIGPTPGSVPWRLLRMEPGDRIFFEAKPGRTSALMQQIAVSICRTGLNSLRKQSAAFCVVPGTRELIELVIVTAEDRFI